MPPRSTIEDILDEEIFNAKEDELMLTVPISEVIQLPKLVEVHVTRSRKQRFSESVYWLRGVRNFMYEELRERVCKEKKAFKWQVKKQQKRINLSIREDQGDSSDNDNSRANSLNPGENDAAEDNQRICDRLLACTLRPRAVVGYWKLSRAVAGLSRRLLKSSRCSRTELGSPRWLLGGSTAASSFREVATGHFMAARHLVTARLLSVVSYWSGKRLATTSCSRATVG
ncbi:hypothetical protein CRG98_001805 [Punica granatum]|uniref:Uncharacterized protein n=1 Tax=Punica granatum TaxID=22663 RepID=A0A2I0LAZ8_PUNGR|nr:hypothetical protein CRG98_001805 [Punica granatum]